MFYQLPPVGNRLCLDTVDDISVQPSLTLVASQFYQSGTAALAAAISAVKLLKNKNHPEVILPAYACPDLVSAAVFAGVKPVLVDLEAERPWLDLPQLADAITGETIAIIGVNLFGIAERWAALRQIAHQNDVILIEDSAQYFPGNKEDADWQGDLVVLSFGRGKPVSLLGGGVVLAKKSVMFDLLPVVEQKEAFFIQQRLFLLKARLYNALLSPYIYWLPQALPFLHLGETRYHALDGLEAMDEARLCLLACNISCYQNDYKAAALHDKISSLLDTLDKVENLPKECKMHANRRLLRYPLLVDAASRDRLVVKLGQSGLGPSTLYPASLPGITGVPDVFDHNQEYPNAEMFASRLITLPTHSNVKDKDIEKMLTILKAA